MGIKRDAKGRFAPGRVCPPTSTATRATPHGPTGPVADTATDMTTMLNGLRHHRAQEFAQGYLDGPAAQWGDLESYPPEQFAGLCEQINGNFAVWLHNNGGDNVVLADYAGNGTGDAPQDYPHTVCVAGGMVYDFTYRQINPDADIPTVVPVEQWERDWRSLNRPVAAGVLEDEDDDWMLYDNR